MGPVRGFGSNGLLNPALGVTPVGEWRVEADPSVFPGGDDPLTGGGCVGSQHRRICLLLDPGFPAIPPDVASPAPRTGNANKSCRTNRP